MVDRVATGELVHGGGGTPSGIFMTGGDTDTHETHLAVVGVVGR